MEEKVTLAIKFAYFTANFPQGFIDKVWKDDPLLANHFKEKLTYHVSRSQYNYVTVETFMRWFFELSLNNMEKLILWVENNYKGCNI